MNTRTVPHDLDAEKSTLGAILISSDLLATVAAVLQPAYFFRSAHATIFKTMLTLDPVDTITLCAALRKADELEECGGTAYIAGLTDGVPRSANVDAYAAIVKQKWQLREVIHTANDLLARAYAAEEDPETLVDAAGASLFALGRAKTHGTLEAMADIVPRAYAVLEKYADSDNKILGLPTGFDELDSMIGGLQAHDFIIIGARPSAGKSSLVLNIAQFVASVPQSKVVAFFSLEMSKESLCLRAMASAAQVPHNRMVRGTLDSVSTYRVGEAMTMVGDSPMYIDDTGNLTVFELRAKARALKRKTGLDLIVIDYLQLMPGDPKAENRTIALGQISRALKLLAKELDVPIIALSQLNRGNEDRKDHRPTLSDLRSSGDLEQDADIVLLVHREEMYKATEDNRGKADIIIAKARNGPTGCILLEWFQEQTRFGNTKGRSFFPT